MHVVDPFGVSGLPAASYNPPAALSPFSEDLTEDAAPTAEDAAPTAEDAAPIAEALVYDPPEQVSEAHWNEEAKALIAGVILHVVTRPPPGGATLAAVRDLLTSAPERSAASGGAEPR